MSSDRPVYYPVYLDLRGRRVLVVGGGSVAARKVRALVECGASVTVVAPEIDPRLKLNPAIRSIERAFRDTDLHGVALVICATNDSVVNRTIARDAQDLGVLVNVVDCPSLCSFILPAVVAHGPVQVSVSTGGASPSLARKLRDLVAGTVGPEYGELAQLVGELRFDVIERVPDPGARAKLFDRLTDEHFLALVREGRADEARRRMQDLVDEAAAECGMRDGGKRSEDGS